MERCPAAAAATGQAALLTMWRWAGTMPKRALVGYTKLVQVTPRSTSPTCGACSLSRVLSCATCRGVGGWSGGRVQVAGCGWRGLAAGGGRCWATGGQVACPRPCPQPAPPGSEPQAPHRRRRCHQRLPPAAATSRCHQPLPPAAATSHCQRHQLLPAPPAAASATSRCQHHQLLPGPPAAASATSCCQRHQPLPPPPATASKPPPGPPWPACPRCCLPQSPPQPRACAARRTRTRCPAAAAA